ncbi:hypothetical protein QQ045_017472 [Rhodiola kirilowii]
MTGPNRENRTGDADLSYRAIPRTRSDDEATALGRGSGAADDEATTLRNRLPAIGSLNLVSENWEFNAHRFLPFLTENTDFTVVRVIGPTEVGKSTIINEIYGFDGSLPVRSVLYLSYIAIDMVVRILQPLFSPSTLSEMKRPEGSSTISVLSGESLTAELAHVLMAIQVTFAKMRDF